jgi:hypothetical protein
LCLLSLAKNFALALLQSPPLNRFFFIQKNGRSQLCVKPTFNELKIETLLMAA